MAFPGYDLSFILHADATQQGLGTVLYQKKANGLWVIACVPQEL